MFPPADAQAVKEACGPITGDAVGSSLSVPPVLTRAGHKLFKYLRLISGPVDVRAGFDSVVDDLLIHLLDELGFNDGPLTILSNNSLRLHMDHDQDIYASTDVTVYDDNSHFRLAVTKVRLGRQIEGRMGWAGWAGWRGSSAVHREADSHTRTFSRLPMDLTCV